MLKVIEKTEIKFGKTENILADSSRRLLANVCILVKDIRKVQFSISSYSEKRSRTFDAELQFSINKRKNVFDSVTRYSVYQESSRRCFC